MAKKERFPEMLLAPFFFIPDNYQIKLPRWRNLWAFAWAWDWWCVRTFPLAAGEAPRRAGRRWRRTWARCSQTRGSGWSGGRRSRRDLRKKTGRITSYLSLTTASTSLRIKLGGVFVSLDVETSLISIKIRVLFFCLRIISSSISLLLLENK